MERIKTLILGGGPAGFTAAIYAARANLSPVLYEGIQPGGQLTTTTLIENFPGYPEGVDANTLMDNMRKQAIHFGTDVRQGTATAVQLDRRPFRITIDAETEIEAETLIVATGVSACATCDGFFYRKRTVAVVGGGDTACEEALYLAGLAKKVYMIVRRDVFRASPIMQKKVLSMGNIEVLWNCNTQEVLGDAMGVTGARLLRKDGSVFDIAIDGFFLAIGHTPASGLFAPWLELDENGYIITAAKSSETSVPGVFAAGDVQDPRYRQAVTAAASGCMAARDAEKFLLEHTNA